MMRTNAFFNHVIGRGLAAISLFALSVAAVANTTEEVAQVAGTVTLSNNVDYVVTSVTPFAQGAVVDIANTDGAVLILSRVKPSVAQGMLSHVRIGGEAAVNGTNCMVKIYANGSIIVPHGKAVRSLTVYTGLDQTGESTTFAADYRRSLTSTAFDNRIRSFVLKRGYMATFAAKGDGKGYSRVFIADKADLTVNLPAILDKAVSSIRVMQWNDVSKKGFAGRDNTINTALGSTWCYNWDAGTDSYADREYVTQRHHESGTKNGKYEGAWPSVDDCSNNGTSPHILGQNEPDNTGDAREVVTKVEDLLKIWPELMATGKRLGSPAMAGNLNMLYQFLDSIDARGWRCDYVVMHCYWYSDWSSWAWNFNNVHSRTGRPIWITEMNYGANWTGWPGSDRSGSAANFAIQKQHMGPILDGLEATPYIERYAYYNAVEDCRAAHLGGSLTPIGEYYAGLQSAVAYNSTYDYVPRLPKSKGSPSNLAVKFDAGSGVAALSWDEPTGEYNKSMVVERQTGTNAWVTVGEVDLKEDAATYTYEDRGAHDGDRYRIRVTYADDKEYTSKTVVAVPDKVQSGDAIEVNGTTMYVGGNVFANGDFALGTAGWTNGEGQELGQPHFGVFPVGGYDGGNYLQSFSNGGKDAAASVKTVVDLVPQSTYYFSSASRVEGGGVSYNRLYLSADGNEESSMAVSIPASATWAKQAGTFESGDYTKAIFGCRWMGGKTQLDGLSLTRLFATRDEAIADGIAAARRRAALVAAYNTVLPAFNGALTAAASAATDEASLKALNTAIDRTVEAMGLKAQADSCTAVANRVLPEQLEGAEALSRAMEAVGVAATAADYVAAVTALKGALDSYLPFVAVDKVANPGFGEGAVSWNTKSGSYTGPTQTATTVAGKTAWSAQWTGLNSSEGEQQTMSVNQTVSKLPHGLYVLQVKAGTEHYNLADQHAYMVTKTDSLVSPTLTADWFDLPTLGNEDKWQTLTTAPVYLSEGDTITIGFGGSKRGAIDYAWREVGNSSSTGDLREGSWAATDFVLRRVPVYHTTVDASGWGTVCLPFTAKPTPGVKFYQVAGINAAQTELYLEEVSEVSAGVPAIIYSEKPQVVIRESGDEVSKPSGSYLNSLRGFFITGARVPTTSLALQNGVWVKPDSGTRPYIGNFHAVIYKLSDVQVLESWDGLSMPVTTATGIRSVESDDAAEAAAPEYYTLDGRRVEQPTAAGIYIRVQNGKATKVVGGR